LALYASEFYGSRGTVRINFVPIGGGKQSFPNRTFFANIFLGGECLEFMPYLNGGRYRQTPAVSNEVVHHIRCLVSFMEKRALHDANENRRRNKRLPVQIT
jgi:hypothetical protein